MLYVSVNRIPAEPAVDVNALMSLPADTFRLSGTGAKTSFLYPQERRASKDDPNRFLPEPQTDVFMAVADRRGE